MAAVKIGSPAGSASQQVISRNARKNLEEETYLPFMFVFLQFNKYLLKFSKY